MRGPHFWAPYKCRPPTGGLYGMQSRAPRSTEHSGLPSRRANMHPVKHPGAASRAIARIGLCAAMLLLLCAVLSTKGKPGRGIGGPGTPASPTSRAGPIVDRYPEPDQDVPPTLEQLNKLRVYDFDPREGIGIEDFTLWTVDDLGRVTPDSQQYVRLTGHQVEHGDYHLVVHVKEAPSLADLDLYLRYHQDRWHPVQCDPGSFFGKPGDRLFFEKHDVPGVVCVAFTRVRPDINGGTKPADAVACEIVFSQRPFDYKPWWLDRAPDGKDNQAANVQAYLDPEDCSPVIYFEERNQGDYNNDGEVMMTDLLPIGRRFGYMTTDAWEDEWDRMVDGNLDGTVNQRDAWIVANHYGALLSGYRLYRRPAGRPQQEEVLLVHRTEPLLPMSVHRPVAWDAVKRNAYRYYDREVPRGAKPQDFIYRIVPYNAANDIEGVGSDLEVKVRISTDMAQVVAGKQPR